MAENKRSTPATPNPSPYNYPVKKTFQFDKYQKAPIADAYARPTGKAAYKTAPTHPADVFKVRYTNRSN